MTRTEKQQQLRSSLRRFPTVDFLTLLNAIQTNMPETIVAMIDQQ